ncbi:MAG: DegT/DnrJ/EryC1/StrS family aminotransferase [Erythrobacter sp.]
MIRLIRPYVSFDEVADDMRQMFDSGVLTRGTNVESFRHEIAGFTGAPTCFLASSATTALWVCLKRLGVGPGDEVIVSDFSFPATANVVADVGATPVFADVSLDTFNMLPTALVDRITQRTKAVIFVDALGNPSGLTEIASICRTRGLPLIEDAACAIGSSEAGRRCGSIADMTCFSFHPRKLLTTGEGGAITLAARDEEAEAWFARKLNHGAEGMAGYGLDFVDFGYNFRLSEPQAVIGRAQLRKLEAIVSARNTIRGEYVKRLEPLGFVPQKIGTDVRFNCQSIVFRVPSGVSRDHLIDAMRAREIETTIGTYCQSGTTYYRQRYGDVQPNAAALQATTITFPCFDGLNVPEVCEAAAKCLERCAS